MGVSAVSAGGDDRRVIGRHAALAEPIEQELLHVGLQHRLAGAQAGGHPRERRVLGFVERAHRAHVRGDLLGSEAAEKVLHEIARGDDFGAERAHALDGAGIDARERRDRAQRRVLHRDAARAGQRAFQRERQRLVRRVDPYAPGKRGKGAALDRVRDQRRLARGRQPVEPSPRERASLERESADRGAVLPAKVAQQPAVEPARAQLGGYGRGIEPQGKTAVTTVWRPPRRLKSAATVIRRGRSAATRSSRIRFATASWKMPSSRYDHR